MVAFRARSGQRSEKIFSARDVESEGAHLSSGRPSAFGLCGIDLPTLPVVSIADLILMKLVAYTDRPEERARDLSDILYCFEHYEQSANTSRRFDYAGAEVEGSPLTFDEAGAYLLGTEVARLAKPNSLRVVRLPTWFA